MDKEQAFIHQRIYPNASEIFSVNIKPIEALIDNCIFVVDTNVLLLPYTTTSSGFEEIRKAFSKLIEKNQLLIPAQVAREFAKNRPEKIKTLFQQLNVTKSKMHKPTTGQYPLLESLNEYKEAIEIEKQVKEVQNLYSKKIDEILARVKNWRWDDPVSLVYKELFKPEFIKELGIAENDILEDLERRNKHSIPPGFNDKSKDDFGIGDLIIWLTILQIAKEHDKDIVFVSGDEKNDWFYRSESQPLYPRFELITEFKAQTNDRSFHIIKLSQLLDLLGATKEAVSEVAIREVSPQNYPDARSLAANTELAIYKWLTETEPGKEIYLDSYPDIIIKDEEKTEGVEVKIVRNSRTILLSPFFRSQYLKAHSQILDGVFDAFRFYIIVTDIKDAESVAQFISRITDRTKNEFIQVFVGIIDDGSFVHVA